MINNFLIGMGVCFIIWLLTWTIASWAWSKYSKHAHEFLYENKNKSKKFQTLYCGLHRIFETVSFTSMCGFAVFFLFSIFELIGI